MAVLIMNMQATVMVAGLLNPESPSAGVRMPSDMKRHMTSMAVVSIESRSLTKSTTATAITARTTPISKVMQVRLRIEPATYTEVVGSGLVLKKKHKPSGQPVGITSFIPKRLQKITRRRKEKKWKARLPG
jgi:hypothetical protein